MRVERGGYIVTSTQADSHDQPPLNVQLKGRDGFLNYIGAHGTFVMSLYSVPVCYTFHVMGYLVLRSMVKDNEGLQEKNVENLVAANPRQIFCRDTQCVSYSVSLYMGVSENRGL